MTHDVLPVLIAGRDRSTGERIARDLNGREEVVVVGHATSEEQLLRQATTRSPAVIIVAVATERDVEAVAWLMRDHALPVVATTRDADLGVRVMAAGAVEVLPADAPIEVVVEAVRVMAGVRVLRRSPRPPERPDGDVNSPAASTRNGEARLPILAIGASTGGPPVVQTLISGLSASFAPPIIIAQHMPADFHAQYAHWLADMTGRAVQVAAAGVTPAAGQIYVAPGDRHLVLSPLGLFATPAVSNSGPVPSIDRLFSSLAGCARYHVCAIILSGMGSDGARGLQELRGVGALTLAQDRRSAIVASMPEQAVASRGAALELPPAGIIEEIRRWATR